MVAKDLNVRLILSGLMGKQKSNSNLDILKDASHPAAVMMMELKTDKTGKLVVYAHFNDNDI
jgi:hypothetical protein